MTGPIEPREERGPNIKGHMTHARDLLELIDSCVLQIGHARTHAKEKSTTNLLCESLNDDCYEEIQKHPVPNDDQQCEVQIERITCSRNGLHPYVVPICESEDVEGCCEGDKESIPV